MKIENYCVFSAHLIHRKVLCYNAKYRTKLSGKDLSNFIDNVDLYELYKELCETGWEPYLLTEIENPLVSTQQIYNPDLYDSCLYKSITNPEIRNVIKFLIRSVITNFEKDMLETTYVKLRIATDMLNRLYYNKMITKEENIYLHENMLRNVLDFKNDFQRSLLPF